MSLSPLISCTNEISSAALSVTANAIEAVAGQTFSGQVARLIDGNPYGRAEDHNILIQWGDGTSSQGTATSNGDGTYSISGTKVYDAPGSLAITVTVSDNGDSVDSSQNDADVQPGSSFQAPTGLTATAVGSDVQLQWNPEQGVDGYSILESTDGINYNEIDEVDGETTSFVDHGWVGGTSVQYKVAALLANSVSDTSSPASVSAQDSVPVALDLSVPVSTASGEYTDIPVISNDFDPDGRPIHVDPASLGTTALGGSLAMNSDGSIRYGAPTAASAIDSFTYAISDGQHDSALATVYLLLNDPGTTLPSPYSPLSIYNSGTQDPVMPVADPVGTGAFTVPNTNDTDGNGTPDSIQSPVPNEIDLMKLVIHAQVNAQTDDSAQLRIVSGDVKLWDSPSKAHAVPTTNGSLTVSASSDHTYWIEALSGSTTLRDIVLQLTYKGTVSTVKATAVWAKKTAQVFSKQTPAGVDAKLGPDWVNNGGEARTVVGAGGQFGVSGTGVDANASLHLNAMVTQYTVVPNLSTIPPASRPTFGITDQIQGVHAYWTKSGLDEQATKLFHFPTGGMADSYGNYTNDYSTTDISPLGHLWVTACTVDGEAGFSDTHILAALRENHNLFVTMTAPGGTGSPSRASSINNWYNATTRGLTDSLNQIGSGPKLFSEGALATFANTHVAKPGTRYYAEMFGLIKARATGSSQPAVGFDLLVDGTRKIDTSTPSDESILADDATTIAVDLLPYAATAFFATSMSGAIVGPGSGITSGAAHGSSLSHSWGGGGTDAGWALFGREMNMKAEPAPSGITPTFGTLWSVSVHDAIVDDPMLGTSTDITLVTDDDTHLANLKSSTFMMKDERTGVTIPAFRQAAAFADFSGYLAANRKGEIVGPLNQSSQSTAKISWIMGSSGDSSPSVKVTAPQPYWKIATKGADLTSSTNFNVPRGGNTVVTVPHVYVEAIDPQNPYKVLQPVQVQLRAGKVVLDEVDYNFLLPSIAFPHALLLVSALDDTSFMLADPVPGGQVQGKLRKVPSGTAIHYYNVSEDIMSYSYAVTAP